MRRLVRAAATAVAALTILAAAACGDGAASPTPGAPQQFTFVAPGGKDVILYDPPPSRGGVTGLAGEDLADPTRTLGLADFSGQVVVLNVWGSWCGPCRAEVPDLQVLHESMKSQGAAVLGVDVRDDRDAARDVLADRAVTYPDIFDQPGRSLLALDGFPRNTVPSTLVLDRQHRVAAVFLRAVRLTELAPVVRRVAAEQASPPAAGAG